MILTNPQQQFIEKAVAKFGTTFTYEKTVYKGSKEKVTITCPIHGDFSITPANFLNVSKYGCNHCGNSNKSKQNKKTTAIFIAEASAIHSNKYTYEDTAYINAYTEVSITCPTHGNFKQKPYVHLQNHGCPECGIEASNIAKRLSVNQAFPVYLYYIEIPELKLWKVGCAKNIKDRLKNSCFPYKYNLIESILFEKSTQAYFTEAWVLKATIDNRVAGFDHISGHTELRSQPILNLKQLIKQAKENYNE